MTRISGIATSPCPGVPERFFRQVVRHAAAARAVAQYPLILAIQGPPGTGKSFQVERSLLVAGCQTVVESASTLSGQYEGDSVTALRRLLARCEDLTVSKPSVPVALLLDDFDLSVAGQHDDTRYTVNSQLLNGCLMNMADSTAAARTHRIPVFLTGNDLTRLYEPLARPGRMEIFSWEPTREELVEMFASVYAIHGLTFDHGFATRMLRRFERRLTVAIVSAAVSSLVGDTAYELAMQAGIGSVSRRGIEERISSLGNIDRDIELRIEQLISKDASAQRFINRRTDHR